MQHTTGAGVQERPLHQRPGLLPVPLPGGLRAHTGREELPGYENATGPGCMHNERERERERERKREIHGGSHAHRQLMRSPRSGHQSLFFFLEKMMMMKSAVEKLRSLFTLCPPCVTPCYDHSFSFGRL